MELKNATTHTSKDMRILRLLHLIEGVNQSIENAHKMDSSLMLRQYQHLKKQYTGELLKLLADYQLSFMQAEAA